MNSNDGRISFGCGKELSEQKYVNGQKVSPGDLGGPGNVLLGWVMFSPSLADFGAK